jgi:hypothetical protein
MVTWCERAVVQHLHSTGATQGRVPSASRAITVALRKGYAHSSVSAERHSTGKAGQGCQRSSEHGAQQRWYKQCKRTRSAQHARSATAAVSQRLTVQARSGSPVSASNGLPCQRGGAPHCPLSWNRGSAPTCRTGHSRARWACGTVRATPVCLLYTPFIAGAAPADGTVPAVPFTPPIAAGTYKRTMVE